MAVGELLPTERNYNIFADKENRISHFVRAADVVSKTLKLVALIFAAIGELVVSDYVRESCYSTTRAIKDTRLVMQLFKIFQGIIPGAVKDVRKLPEAWAEGKPLKFGQHFTGLIGKLGIIFGFGACKPIMFLERQWGDLGGHAHAIGELFPIVMTVTNASSLTSGTLRLAGDQTLDLDDVYRRSITHSWTDAEYALMRDKTIRDFQSTVSGLCESTAELTMSAISLSAVSAPFYVRIPLALIAACCGLYRVWVGPSSVYYRPTFR